MEKWLNKLERKHGGHAIKNLTLYVIVGYLIGYMIQIAAPDIYQFILLDPYKIMHGQVWRLVTWVIAPPSKLGIFTIIMLMFYYSIGGELERQWGAFRYNVYLLSGIVFNIIGAFLVYFIYIVRFGTSFSADYGMGISVLFSTYYVVMSLYFAYAALNPDQTILFYMVIPIKIKWLAYFNAVVIVFSFIMSDLATKVCIIMSLLNFIIYFVFTANWYRVSPTRMKKAHKYKSAVENTRPKNQAMHTCCICGKTNEDYPDLDFRYCSKCKGNREYCAEHLFTHEHIQ